MTTRVLCTRHTCSHDFNNYLNEKWLFFLEKCTGWIPKCQWQNLWVERQAECLDPWVATSAEDDLEPSCSCRAGNNKQLGSFTTCSLSYTASNQVLYMQVSHFSLTTWAVPLAARCLCHQTPCSPSLAHFPGRFCLPLQQKASQSSSAACSSDRAWTRHPPPALWCEAGAVWPAGPGGRTGSCPERRACGFPDVATLTRTKEKRFVSVLQGRSKTKQKIEMLASPFWRGINNRRMLSAMISGSSCSSCSSSPMSSSLGLQTWSPRNTIRLQHLLKPHSTRRWAIPFKISFNKYILETKTQHTFSR